MKLNATKAEIVNMKITQDKMNVKVVEIQVRQDFFFVVHSMVLDAISVTDLGGNSTFSFAKLFFAWIGLY